MSLPHHDGLLVDRVDDDLNEEIDGMAADFAIRLDFRRMIFCVLVDTCYLCWGSLICMSVSV